MKIKKFLIRLYENIDETLAKLGIVLGLLGTILSALLSGGFYILALSTSFICLSYLYIKRKKPIPIMVAMTYMQIFRI